MKEATKIVNRGKTVLITIHKYRYNPQVMYNLYNPNKMLCNDCEKIPSRKIFPNFMHKVVNPHAILKTTSKFDIYIIC